MPFYWKILIQQKIQNVDQESSLKNKKILEIMKHTFLVQICG